MNNYNAIFNNFNLKNTNYHVTKIDVSSPKPKVNKYELARGDGQVISYQNYGERLVTVTGSLKATTIDEMHDRLDTLKQNLVGINKTLDVYIGTKKRRYVATMDSFNYTTAGYFCEYEVVFTCDAFAKELTSNTLTFGTFTATNTSYSNTIIGSYKAEPYIDFTVTNCISYINAKYIQIKNASLNQRIRFTKTWTFGDRVIVDGPNKTCTIYPSTRTLIDNMDSATGWTSSTATISLDETNEIEGTGAVKAVMAAANTFCNISRLNYATTIDLSSTIGTILFPVFIPTPTAGAVSYIRLTAGSDADTTTNSLYWNVSTQYDGSALATNAWNYIKVDLSTAATSTTGSPVRTAIKSFTVSIVGTAATMQLNGALLDYISIYKTSIVGQALDFEGTFPDLNLGVCALTFEDEFTARSITATGSYYQRWI
jgi:hypothetical protein